MIQKRKRGRPRKDEAAVRSETLHIRLDQDTSELFKKTADDIGITVSKLIRNAVFFQRDYFDQLCGR